MFELMIVQHIKTPEKIHLMWQDGESHCYRVGELTENSFRYLLDDEEFEQAKALNFKGYPAFPLNDKKYKNPVSAFIRRCQPRSRTGFPKYLKCFGLDPEQKEVREMSDFQLLTYTGAIVPGDPFSLAGSFKGIEPPFEFLLQIEGFKRSQHPDWLESGEFTGKELKIVKEKDHPNDKNPLKVILQGNKVGCIPKTHTDSFRCWMDNDQLEKVRVFKMSGANKPPYLHVFVAVVITTKIMKVPADKDIGGRHPHY